MHEQNRKTQGIASATQDLDYQYVICSGSVCVIDLFHIVITIVINVVLSMVFIMLVE